MFTYTESKGLRADHKTGDEIQTNTQDPCY